MPTCEDSPIHIHLAAMAPQFMDVRTTLPLRALEETPGITISLSRQKVELPQLTADQPKVLVIQRIGVPDVVAYKASVRTMVERGWVVVAEFDDHPDLVNAVHGRPPSDAMWHSIRLGPCRPNLNAYALADAFRSYNSKVAFFPNAAFRLGTGAQRAPARRDDPRLLWCPQPRAVLLTDRGSSCWARIAKRPQAFEFVVVHDRAFFAALGPANKRFLPALPYDQVSCHDGRAVDIALMPLEGGAGRDVQKRC